MAVKRFVSNFKNRTDIFDQITPNTKYTSDHIITAGGQYKPAPWLPIIWQDTASEDAFVISSGKVVALTTDGFLVPAGLRIKMEASGITYAQVDVDFKVEDITTGEAVVAPVAYSALTVARRLVERGLVLEDDVSAITAAEVIPAFISHPVGIMQYDVYVWAGDEDALKFTNYRKQHLISFMKQVEMIVPHMVSSNEAADAFDAATLDGAGSTVFVAASEMFPDAGQYWDADNLAEVNRYSTLITDASPVVALGLAHQPVAVNTDRTPFACDIDGVLVREVSSIDKISKEGDWFLDAKVGVLILHEDTWATQVAAAATLTFSYDYYDDATATSERYVHLDGRCKPGDKVVVDADSNLTKADLSTVAFYEVLGTVHQLISEPKGLLDRVRSAWNHSGIDKTMQMPGTATKGFSDLITLSDEPVADQLAIVFINIK